VDRLNLFQPDYRLRLTRYSADGHADLHRSRARGRRNHCIDLQHSCDHARRAARVLHLGVLPSIVTNVAATGWGRLVREVIVPSDAWGNVSVAPVPKIATSEPLAAGLAFEFTVPS
jgi:hypothetical protein